tara:strand:+ start:45 stop:500 length:456 start_codon:yes stop_codon:yes gene_type:complete
MPDYKNGKIYKLWSPEGDEIYIGSTTQSLSRRKAKHKSQTDKCKSSILYEKYTDVRIELLEEVSCDNKEQLIKKEGEYIRNNNCVNKFIPDRTKKEYDKEWSKEYRENNKEQIKERKSIKITCDCGRTIRLNDKAIHLKTKIHNDLMKELK